MTDQDTSVRLDKWLWAARFFKTRSLAKQAVEGGKVHYQGAKVKPSKEVHLDKTLTIRQGFSEKTVVIKGLSAARKSASEAAWLYEETPQSIEKRQQNEEQRRMQKDYGHPGQGRPTKKDRRQIHEFKEKARDGDE